MELQWRVQYFWWNFHFYLLHCLNPFFSRKKTTTKNLSFLSTSPSESFIYFFPKKQQKTFISVNLFFSLSLSPKKNTTFISFYFTISIFFFPLKKREKKGSGSFASGKPAAAELRYPVGVEPWCQCNVHILLPGQNFPHCCGLFNLHGHRTSLFSFV